MALPSYVIQANIYFNGVLTNAVLLRTSGSDTTYLLYDKLDTTSQQTLDSMIQANGGTNPPTGYSDMMALLQAPINSLGVTNWNMFEEACITVGAKPLIPNGPFLKDLIYYDGSSWKYLYNDSAV